VPLVSSAELAKAGPLLAGVRMIEVIDGPDAVSAALQAQRANGNLMPALRLPLTPKTGDRIVDVARSGVKVFHVQADTHGNEIDAASPRHIKDAMRDVHRRLVQEHSRDEITLIVGGGIALAEHMAKAIICGADLVAADVALLVALGCRACGGAPIGIHHQERCAAEIAPEDTDYAAQRMVNLMGAWHAQLIEVLGAMGIREVRRLRGEVGRAIFVEDIEREAFGDLVHK
jgi:hypothetical protein